MFECTYTKDKIKKAKIWLDGFITITGSTVNLFNEDKKCIYRTKYKHLLPELILPSYIIYCEKIGLPAQDDSSEKEAYVEKKIMKKPESSKIKKISYGENKRINANVNSNKFAKSNNEKERVTDTGIILIDENGISDKKLKFNDNDDRVVGRSKDEILKILQKNK